MATTPTTAGRPPWPTPDTFPLRPAEVTIPGVTTDDTTAIADIVADATVTADELIGAYERYVGCLVDGGGAGRYAYDIELRTGLAVEWTITEDDPTDLDRNVLCATCSARYLGTITQRLRAGQPGGGGPRQPAQRQHRRLHRADQPGGRGERPR